MAKKIVKVGNLSKISGEVNIAAGNIIRNIHTIYQRSLTAAEEAEKARSLENKLLADGVSSYIQRLQIQAKSKSEAVMPYKGLLEFRLADAEFFYGRKQATQSLLQTMGRGSLTILHAESGAGKTSLLQAGIVPHILVYGHLPLYLRPYDKSPSLVIKQAFQPDLSQSPILTQTPLRDYLARVMNVLGKNSILFILIDQFEEFFTLVDEKEQFAFIDELGECLDDKSLNVCWLFSLRSEYFSRLANFRPRIQNPYENDFLLNRLTREEASEAIKKPIEKYQIEFEPGLVDKILNDLGKNKIAPPQLQLVCSALYEALDPGETTFTRKIYEVREGGATGILRGHLERVLKRLTPDKRTIARQVLEALITSVQQRVLRPRNELLLSLSARGLDVSKLQDTIDQLVESRLLRVEESDEGLAYELAHDYLLNEIKLDPEVVKRKRAEELLEQGLSNWKKYQLLLAPDAQKVIEAHKDELIIPPDAAKLFFLSAIKYKGSTQKWVDLLSEEARGELISRYLPNKRKQNSREVLWALRQYLTPQSRMEISTIKYISTFLNASLKITILMTFIVLTIIIIRQGINSTFFFLDWSAVKNYENQCLGGNKPSQPLIEIDATSGSYIVAYDPFLAKLCKTNNTGGTWELIETKLPENTTVNAIDVNEQIYLLTNKGILYQTQKSIWEPIYFPEGVETVFQELTVSPDKEKAYLIGENESLLKYDFLTKEWEGVDLNGITGKITDITMNYTYLAISTRDGIWYQKTAEETAWHKYDLRISEDIVIVSIAMVRPVRTWTRNFFNPGEDDRFLALSDSSAIYSGYLTGSEGLNPIGPPPVDIKKSDTLSLSVNLNSKFIASSNGLFCQQSWTILDSEWWAYKFGKSKPCS